MFNLSEALTSLDLETFRAYVSCFADSDGGCITVKAPTEQLLEPWRQAKGNLYEMFGNKVILSKSFTYEKTFEDFREEFSEYLDCDTARALNRIWRDLISSFQYGNNFGIYTNTERQHIIRNLDYFCFYNTNSYFNNIYDGYDFELRNREGRTLKINHGCKLMKAMGKILDFCSCSKSEFEQFRIDHSMMLNQKRLTGELSLSIHPMDYATMSDNNCDWDSCMSWISPGEYRLGTIEMMNSPYVVVGYMTSKEPLRFWHNSKTYEWNSKKWRCLFIVNNDVVYPIKEYPYTNTSLVGECLTWLKALATDYGYGPYTDHLVHLLENEYVIAPIAADEIQIDMETNAMFNDCYGQRDAFLRKTLEDKFYFLNYSGVANCMCCGKVDNDIYEGSGRLVLDCCDRGHYCYYCNAYRSEDDMEFINGQWYCSYCADQMKECARCYEIRHGDSMEYLMLAEENSETGMENVFYPQYSATFCSCCMEELEEEGMETFQRRWENYVNVRSLKPKHLDFFDIWNEEKKEYFLGLCEQNDD